MKFLFENNRVKVRQEFLHPAIYFDHWALCEFSDNFDIQNQLIELMKRKNGTLVVSNINLLEFTKMDDQKHVKAAELFLNRLLPNVYLADFNLEQALEFDLKHPHEKMCPPPDLKILKVLADRCLTLNTDISFDGFINFSYLHKDSLGSLLSDSVEGIAKMLEGQKKDQSYLKKSRLTLPDLERPKTYVIMGELIRGLIIDPKTKIKHNDIIDSMHAILSLSCCDYVLLDGAWEQRAKNMQARIFNQKIKIETARCFSKRNNGIQNFLDDLANF